MADMIVLDVFGKNGLIETIKIDIDDYYDGGAYDELIDKSNIVSKGITSVKGTQYGSKGKPYHIWIVYFNEMGEMGRSEDLLNDDTLL